ncbi:MAG: hypothetical protein NXY57DRAFT_961435 [Lentinula lateritia]|uniref:TEA domain-containing protein n=1 Tax=Lentinula lateritia TaxID=40482 RepID=A0ABQ8V6F8_9AGAR|nr:hypothetical protein EV359DRAFT_80833 [Lentinula novae-zelandiae]KAJ3931806.1 MAG: hypothetical protein NXY57DRAFT_961435 [Lentinula lateritia]KAJ4467845.1 hypothetical protein C8R41DRAFT_46180 [Lentinula lateritia]
MAHYSPSMSNSHYVVDSDASSTSSPSPSLESCSLDPAFSTAVSGTDDVFRAVVKCRKSWKTLKGGKVVWPLHLEAALLEGLSLYQPDNSRETLLLGRFPMRNRFISEHILKTTGESRTAKQVGSRLQQLRDTCGGGRKLQKLLSPVLNSGAPISNRSHYSLRRSGSRSSVHTAGSSSVPTSPISQELEFSLSSNVMYIDIVPEDGPSVGRKGSSHIDITSSRDAIVSSAHGPRPIRSIKPSLAFTSSFDASVAAQSMFTIYYADVCYEDQSVLTAMVNQAAPGGSTLYTCDLVPRYWNMICNSPDPTSFTIQHRVIREPYSSFSEPTTLFSATYKFRYVPEKVSPPQISPFSAVNSSIGTFQEMDTSSYRDYNGPGYSSGSVSEMSSSFDSKWDCFNDLSGGQRGYTSLPTTPDCWDEYNASSIDGSCSSSSSPTTSNFPQHSHFYPLHQI